MSTEKTQVFLTAEEWAAYKKKYTCKNTCHKQYFDSNPIEYPCIGIEECTNGRCNDKITTIENFVYLSDFNK